jgi:hypothetical protein
VPYNPLKYEELRKRRMRGLIDENDWARQLSSKETRRDKENIQKQLDELLISVARDSIFAFINSNGTRKEIDFDNEVMVPLLAAKEYYNQHTLGLSKINEFWELRVLKP